MTNFSKIYTIWISVALGIFDIVNVNCGEMIGGEDSLSDLNYLVDNIFTKVKNGENGENAIKSEQDSIDFIDKIDSNFIKNLMAIDYMLNTDRTSSYNPLKEVNTNDLYKYKILDPKGKVQDDPKGKTMEPSLGLDLNVDFNSFMKKNEEENIKKTNPVFSGFRNPLNIGRLSKTSRHRRKPSTSTSTSKPKLKQSKGTVVPKKYNIFMDLDEISDETDTQADGQLNKAKQKKLNSLKKKQIRRQFGEEDDDLDLSSKIEMSQDQSYYDDINLESNEYLELDGDKDFKNTVGDTQIYREGNFYKKFHPKKEINSSALSKKIRRSGRKMTRKPYYEEANTNMGDYKYDHIKRYINEISSSHMNIWTRVLFLLVMTVGIIIAIYSLVKVLTICFNFNQSEDHQMGYKPIGNEKKLPSKEDVEKKLNGSR